MKNPQQSKICGNFSFDNFLSVIETTKISKLLNPPEYLRKIFNSFHSTNPVNIKKGGANEF